MTPLVPLPLHFYKSNKFPDKLDTAFIFGIPYSGLLPKLRLRRPQPGGLFHVFATIVIFPAESSIVAKT